MIGPSGTVRVMVATKPVDFRNYAEPTIMRVRGGKLVPPRSSRLFHSA